ncbi:c-type cytochrome [Hyphomicrobium sp. 2TAF46]|uniref:c-type cytochrome n=1 Tax=Hyphomicrobium sp. 2TAF46 TaxID=3233019 RepID=UPI003F91EB62
MSMLRRAAAAIFVPVVATAGVAADRDLKAPHLGAPLSAGEIAKWDRTIFADGRGLPPGKGTAKDGRVIYEQKCASCHGLHGEGGTAEELVGGPKPPSAENPSKAIGSYWPFAPTIFDFVRRSMPPAAAGSLSADETYALTAYLLAANGVIGEGDEMNAKTLAAVRMPNRDGFIWIDAKP